AALDHIVATIGRPARPVSEPHRPSPKDWVNLSEEEDRGLQAQYAQVQAAGRVNSFARHLAALELQTALLDGRVKARGPGGPIESEFWRFAVPEEDGTATVNVESGRKLLWFEVAAGDVLAGWPPAPDSSETQTAVSSTADRQPKKHRGGRPPEVSKP